MKGILIVLLLALPGPSNAAEAVFLSRITWSLRAAEFGGLSGFELGKGGQRFTAISDRGWFFTGTLLRKNGKLIGVKPAENAEMKVRTGDASRNFNADAEGLAEDGHGGFYVSFEGNHRVSHYAGINSGEEKIKRHADFAGFQRNSGMEALAIDPKGTLYTLPERSGDWERPYPVYRLINNTWDKPFLIPRRGTHLPVGADIGPDGKFYLLERDFAWYRGFSSRIRRFDITSKGLINEETLLITNFGTRDNLEGLSVWKDDQGVLRITMISDDNFSFLQVTEIVEYKVVPTPQ